MSTAVVPNLKLAQKWFDAATQECLAFQEAWKKARVRAISSGFLFLKARSLCPHGEWTMLLETNAAKVKPRTVQFFMQLSEAALEWARTEHPDLNPAKMEQFAITQVMLMSPKPLVALLRDLREMRPFGEYDAVKYAQKKINNGAGQIEFAFESSFTVLDALAHFGDDKYQFVYPAGRDEAEVISEVEAKLEAALARVRQIKQQGRVTDV